ETGTPLVRAPRGLVAQLRYPRAPQGRRADPGRRAAWLSPLPDAPGSASHHPRRPLPGARRHGVRPGVLGLPPLPFHRAAHRPLAALRAHAPAGGRGAGRRRPTDRAGL
ncbi:MAG: hypothetical protein AVDCRST_MAG89-2600, partial [uncultured Gemmatimonadetes bacterium]